MDDEAIGFVTLLRILAPIFAFFVLILNGWLLFSLGGLRAGIRAASDKAEAAIKAGQTRAAELQKEINDLQLLISKTYAPLSRFERLVDKVDELRTGE